MEKNCAIAYMGYRKVEVQSLDLPKLVGPADRKCNHEAILKIVTMNICGSDHHIYRGRFSAPQGMVLEHEILATLSRWDPMWSSPDDMPAFNREMIALSSQGRKQARRVA